MFFFRFLRLRYVLPGSLTIMCSRKSSSPRPRLDRWPVVCHPAGISSLLGPDDARFPSPRSVTQFRCSSAPQSTARGRAREGGGRKRGSWRTVEEPQQRRRRKSKSRRRRRLQPAEQHWCREGHGADSRRRGSEDDDDGDDPDDDDDNDDDGEGGVRGGSIDGHHRGASHGWNFVRSRSES